MLATNGADAGLQIAPPASASASDDGALLVSAHTARLRSQQLRAEMRARLDRLGDLYRGRPPGSAPSTPGLRSPLLRRVHEQLVQAQDQIRHLETALASNRRIGIAIGILMARHRLTEQDAFDRLSRHSQRHNIKLRELAERVIYTGAL